jgi:hypothetical protein
MSPSAVEPATALTPPVGSPSREPHPLPPADLHDVRARVSRRRTGALRGPPPAPEPYDPPRRAARIRRGADTHASPSPGARAIVTLLIDRAPGISSGVPPWLRRLARVIGDVP